jgi:cytochrome b6
MIERRDPIKEDDDMSAGIMRKLREKTVPSHQFSFWYYVGGLTLFAFGVQVLTGILLVYYFEPVVGRSAKSLEMIVRQVPFGRFIRSLHAWSASASILLMFVHLCVAFFLRSYRGKWKSLWLTGVPLILILSGFGYTGWLLPHVQGSSLRLFYALHVAVLPLAGLLILGAHLSLSAVLGSPVPDTAHVRSYRRYFPDYVLGELIVWLVGLICLLLIAWFFPWEFNGRAFAPPNGWKLNIPDDWFLLWQQGWLGEAPALLYWATVLIFLSLLAAIPYIIKDRKGAGSGRFVRSAGVVVLVILACLSVLAYYSSPG